MWLQRRDEGRGPWGFLNTNKPRVLSMQQALYNEPQRSCLLWDDGMPVQTLRRFPLQKKEKASSLFYLPQSLDQHLPKPPLPHLK